LNLIKLYKMANFLHKNKIPLLPKIIYYIQFLLFNSSVPSKCSIGEGTKFAYGGIGVVIHERAVIGKKCIIGQGVTIGGKSHIYEVPNIGNNVYIGAGARVLGNVEIGDDVVIGANSVVVKTVPSNCIVAGIPATIIKRNIKMSDYA